MPEIVGRFLEAVRAWGDVEVVAAGSYMRCHRRPSRAGAFAYVWPRAWKVNLRLPARAADAAEHARARKVKADNPYQVTLFLSEANFDEAVGLAQRAWEEVGELARRIADGSHTNS